MKNGLLILLLATSLFAKEAVLPSELSAWKALSYVGSAKNPQELPNATLTLNTASLVGLLPTPKIQYVARPTNEGGSVSYGGMFQITLKESGLYRVVLANASWIEMVKDAKGSQSVAHSHGPDYSGIRKMVDYALEAGTYTLQLSAGADTTSAILVTKLK